MQRMLAAFASGDIAEARALVGDHYIDHQDDRVVGREGFAELVATVHRLYPDLVVEAADMIAEGDRVVARARWRATRLLDRASVNAESIDIVRFADGEAVEHWGISRGWD